MTLILRPLDELKARFQDVVRMDQWRRQVGLQFCNGCGAQTEATWSRGHEPGCPVQEAYTLMPFR